MADSDSTASTGFRFVQIETFRDFPSCLEIFTCRQPRKTVIQSVLSQDGVFVKALDFMREIRGNVLPFCLAIVSSAAYVAGELSNQLPLVVGKFIHIVETFQLVVIDRRF